MGFPTQTTVASVGTLSLRPGIDGLVEGLTPPSQPEHTFRYDVLGRETAYAPAGETLAASGCAPGTSCTGYDRAGRVTSVQHEDGTATTIAYLATRGLVDHVDVPSDGRYQFGYDAVGRPTSIVAPDGGRVTYSWQASWPVREVYSGTHVVRDATTNAIVWTGALGGTLDRTYSEFLELDTVSVTGGYGQRFTRDADGLVTAIGPVSGTAVPALTLARSPLDGHVTSTTAGVVATAIDLDIDASAPGFGDLRSLSATRSTDGATLYDADYEVDDAGRIVRWTETVEGVTSDRRFDYDAASRLVGVRDATTNAPLATYAFDGNGNRTRVLDVRAGAGAQDVELGVNLGCDDAANGTPLARAATAQDQVCRYGDFTYAYDDNGRLRTRTNAATGQTLALRYDAAGRLHQATNEAGQTVHYVNDALGRRIGRIVNGALERGWIYGSELAPIAEVNAAGQVTQTYVYASRPNVPDLIVQADGDVYRVVHDHLGSVRLVVNVATGVVAHRMRFDEWGVLVEESGDTTLHPFGYAGGLYDRTTGLTMFGARDYEPGTGRWTAKDPIGFEGGDSNVYSYVSNEPIGRIDPIGLQWHDAFDLSSDSAFMTASNFLVGLADGASFGIGRLVRNASGGDGLIDECSTSYAAGGIASLFLPGGPGRTAIWAFKGYRAYRAAARGAGIGSVLGPTVMATVKGVLKGDLPRSALSFADAARGAGYYLGVATRTTNALATEAAAYNNARAAYLAGARGSLPRTIVEFMGR